MKIFSFSLYGDKPLYNCGAIENARVISLLGEEWKSVFYCSKNTDPLTLRKLTSLGAQVVIEEDSWHSNGMFWRFKPLFECDFTHLLIRDADSRISRRELDAVSEWIDSKLIGHIMRDHPFHMIKMLGGMWGVTEEVKNLGLAVDDMKLYKNVHGEDQKYLVERIYPKLRGKSMIHDSFFKYELKSLPFPSRRIEGQYVGEVIDEFGGFDINLRRILENYERKPLS